MQSKYAWINRILAQLDGCLEFESLGGFCWRVTADHLLIVAPSLSQIMGGQNDGGEVFPFFHFQISEFAQVFDEPPDMNWSTSKKSLWFEGRIGGEDAWLEVRSEPFDDEEPHFNLYADGSLGER